MESPGKDAEEAHRHEEMSMWKAYVAPTAGRKRYVPPECRLGDSAY